MGIFTTLVTVGEFLTLPDPSGRFELHHGEVVTMPPPKWRHEQLQERIRTLLARSMSSWGIVRVEMAFQPLPEYEVWRADIGVVKRERAQQTPPDSYLQGAPDIVVEVLSPGNTAEEIAEKIDVCLRHGCSGFWVVNDRLKQVEITGQDYITQRFSGDDAILHLAEFRCADIFSEEEL